jgi:hypothetical protein
MGTCRKTVTFTCQKRSEYDNNMSQNILKYMHYNDNMNTWSIRKDVLMMLMGGVRAMVGVMTGAFTT